MRSSQEGHQSGGMGARAMMQAFNMGSSAGSIAMPDAPTMRSLAIGSGPAPLLQRPPSFGKPPSFGIERPRSLSARQSGGSIGLKQVWDAPVTSWNVSKDDLELVPEDFPLERTSRYLHNVEAPEVATRIAKALQQHSIQAEYKNKPPKAKCKTQDFVSFRIRLYAADESGSPVVVEVQRRSGPASCFMHACRAILNAAEGKVEEKTTKQLPAFMRKPISEMKCIAVVSEDEEDTAATALKDSVNMVRSKQRDTNVLGLENLCALTDPIKSKPSVARRVAKSIVLGHGGVDVREDIVAMIERDVFSAVEDVSFANHTYLLRQLALTIFSNTLSLCAKDGCLSGEEGEQSWFFDNLLPCLVDEIKRATSDACCATQAASCVHSFASSSESAKEFLLDQGVVDALRKAHEYGIACNDLLAEEAERCLHLVA